MTGNARIYEQAMNMGNTAAWDGNWDKAIAAYGRAVQEMPEDPAAHNSLGMALLQARRLEDALKVYTRAHQLSQDDPIPLERSADVLERLGRLKEAAQQYINVAEVYLGQRDLDKAIGNWERATRLTSGLVHIHQRLALAYERMGQKKSAIREYLTLAFNFQRSNRPKLAEQAVQRALRLEPQNPQALNTLQALKAGALIEPEVLESERASAPAEQRRQIFAPVPEEERSDGDADPRGPLGEAIEMALSALATFVFESGDLSEGAAHAIQAIEFQREDRVDEAIGSYQRALAAGFSHAAIYLSLGSLQLERNEMNRAVDNFELAATDTALAPGALHGISLVKAAQGSHREASGYLIQTLRFVDVGLAISPDEAEQIASIYDRLIAGMQQADEVLLARLNERFLDRLTGPEWKQRVAKTRRQIEEEITLEKPEDLIETMIYIDDSVTEGLNLIDRYVRQGLYTLAMDQAHYMLENAPDYLPVHQRIGQILLERDNIPAAMAKYNLVAETYLMRGDTDRATEILREALKIAPMDVELHRSLIKLLEEQEAWSDVLDQHIDLADAYYQLADLEAARATYQAAINLAQRVDLPPQQIIHIMHRLADIDVSRLDLRQAMRTYEQIRRMDPNDERARRALVDLNYRLNDAVSAIQELDGLLRMYAKSGKANRIIQVLEEQVTRYSNDMALRSRLAAVYRQTGNTARAVEQLDALAELQLEAGMHSDAVVTIRRIIALNPPQVNDYKRLLQQLSGS